MTGVPRLFMSVRESHLKPGIVSKADNGAVGYNPPVCGIVVWSAKLQHEVTATQVHDKRLDVGGILAAAVEESAKPRAYCRFLRVTRLRNHYVQYCRVDSRMEITVCYRLQLLEAPVVLRRFRPPVGETFGPYAVLSAMACCPQGGIHLLLTELLVVHPELGPHPVRCASVRDAVCRERTVGVRFAPCAQAILVRLLRHARPYTLRLPSRQ